MNPFVAIDWGTTALRGARLGGDGAVIEERSFERGAAGVAPAAFEAVFDEHFGDWMTSADTLCLIGGMAGSKQGWVEAPYAPCPARFEDLCDKLTWVGSRRIAILPGLSCMHGGIPDVMRGEEAQVFGALALLGRLDALLVLPGTHSKWVHVRAGQVRSFATVMTGEFYALLRRHSLLARSMPTEDAEFDAPAFDQGVTVALSSRSLMQTAFGVRTLSLFERVRPQALPSYLSGLVIGEELRSQMNHDLEGGGEVIVIGADALTRRYERALSQQGNGVKTLGAQAGWRGLWAVAQAVQGAPGAPGMPGQVAL
ncbi:MAG: 2-dehydro-3-deoxygalactonokinase [Burkholderiaceae bacterium]